MHAERDYLIKVTFPTLREKLLPHRVELYDIDLRWGITEDEAKNEKVIGLCLEQVDECRPFFLAFLGHRYGWVPAQVSPETQQRFPFLRRFPGVSVTELELRYGAMLDPTGRHTLVLLRKEEAVASIPEAIRKRDFLESDPHLQEKLATLKQELEAGPYPVQPYSAAWDPKRYDRVNRTEGKLAQLDEFGKQVEDWLWEAIRKQLQLAHIPAVLDPLDAEADLHERFLELQTRIYIGREDLHRELREFALADGELPLLLGGESGLGKSAALANFVLEFRKTKSQRRSSPGSVLGSVSKRRFSGVAYALQRSLGKIVGLLGFGKSVKDDPDIFVLPHFVGASPRTTSLVGMLLRLTDELQRKFDLKLPKAESPAEIIHKFTVAITTLPKSARVVLVLDALNQLDADSRAESLIWLPERLPPNVRVLCSCATGPQKPPRVLTAFRERDYVNLSLRPLSYRECWKLIRKVPKLVAKTLDKKQRRALLANAATQNPLFLMVALEELRGYGSFERLNEMIAGLPREGDAVTKLFDQVFERLEQEFNKPLVDWTLRLLGCSRRGLSGPELVELTRHLGEQADDLCPVLRQLRPYLHVRDGFFDFYHMSIRRAVEVRYLRWDTEEDQHDPWVRWNPERKPTASEPTEPEREARHRLINMFDSNRLSPRAIDELPWQLSQMRDWQRLFDLLADLRFFHAAWEKNEFEVREFWGRLEAASELRMLDAYRSVLDGPGHYSSGQKYSIATLLQRAGHRSEATIICDSLVKQYRDVGDEGGESRAQDGQVVNLAAQGHWNQAMDLLREQEESCRRRNDLPHLARCLGHQAMIHSSRGDLDAALRLHQEEEKLYRNLGSGAGVARSAGHQAMIRHARGEQDIALRTLRDVEQVWRLLNQPGQLARTLGNQAVVMQAKGDFVRALSLLQQAEDIFRRINDPEGLAGTLNNQSSILAAQGQTVDSSLRAEEALKLSLKNSDPLARCISLLNKGKASLAHGDLDGALLLFQQVTELANQMGMLGEGAHARLGLANVLLQRGKVEEAISLFQQAEAIYRQISDHSGIATCLGLRAEVFAARGELDAADVLLRQMEGLCRRINDTANLAACLGCQASVLYDRGRMVEAMLLHKQQEDLCRTSKNLAGLARSLGGQAVILQVQKKWTEALNLHREVERLCRSLEDVDGLATSLVNQAHVLAFGRGNHPEAIPLAEEAARLIRTHNLKATAAQVMPVVEAIRFGQRST